MASLSELITQNPIAAPGAEDKNLLELILQLLPKGGNVEAIRQAPWVESNSRPLYPNLGNLVPSNREASIGDIPPELLSGHVPATPPAMLRPPPADLDLNQLLRGGTSASPQQVKPPIIAPKVPITAPQFANVDDTFGDLPIPPVYPSDDFGDLPIPPPREPVGTSLRAPTATQTPRLPLSLFFQQPTSHEDPSAYLNAMSKIIEQAYPESLEKVSPRPKIEQMPPVLQMFSDMFTRLTGADPEQQRMVKQKFLDENWRQNAGMMLQKKQALAGLQMKMLDHQMEKREKLKKNQLEAITKIPGWEKNAPLFRQFLQLSDIPENQADLFILEHIDPTTGEMKIARTPVEQEMDAEGYRLRERVKLLTTAFPNIPATQINAWAANKDLDYEKMFKNKFLDESTSPTERAKIGDILTEYKSLDNKSKWNDVTKFMKFAPVLIKEGLLDPKIAKQILQQGWAVAATGQGLPKELLGEVSKGKERLEKLAMDAIEGNAEAVAFFKRTGINPTKDVLLPKTGKDDDVLLPSYEALIKNKISPSIVPRAIADKAMMDMGAPSTGAYKTIVDAFRGHYKDWFNTFEKLVKASNPNFQLTDDIIWRIKEAVDKIGYFPDAAVTASDTIKKLSMEKKPSK